MTVLGCGVCRNFECSKPSVTAPLTVLFSLNNSHLTANKTNDLFLMALCNCNDCHLTNIFHVAILFEN